MKMRWARMYCSVLTVVLLSLPINAHTLTTFGKTQQSSNNQPPPPPAVKGRECSNEADCAGQQNTSCVPDPLDKKLRCLCGDNQAPMNGQCHSKYKGLRHACNSDRDCLAGGACVVGNGTIDRNLRTCHCMEGYVEINNICSGGDPSARFQIILLIAMPILSWATLKLSY